MVRTELSREELALESVELLPDRDTMQLLGSSYVSAANTAAVDQSNTGTVDTGVGDATLSQSNTSTIEQSNDVTSSGSFTVGVTL